MKILLAISLIASAAAATPPPIPNPVSAHVKDGHFNSNDFNWLRGAFPGATAVEVADWQAISAYADHCRGTVPDAVRAEMATLGEHPPTAYWLHYTDDICGEVQTPRHTVDGFKSWADYHQALGAALPYYRSFVFAVARAQAIAPLGAGSLHDQLQAIVVPDQMLRAAVVWGEGEASDAPPMNSQARDILTKLLWRPIRDIDHRNTSWLKGVISKDGWPTISNVGKSAATNAWLLAQHSDDDPVFQLRVMRLMAPLVAKGEVESGNYALLFDRVMLPLTGKQRYGTQFTCIANRWRPQALENEADLDRLRKEVGLNSISEYTKQINESSGDHC